MSQGTTARITAAHVVLVHSPLAGPATTPMAAFQTLLGLGARHPTTTYAQITGNQAAA